MAKVAIYMIVIVAIVQDVAMQKINGDMKTLKEYTGSPNTHLKDDNQYQNISSNKTNKDTSHIASEKKVDNLIAKASKHDTEKDNVDEPYMKRKKKGRKLLRKVLKRVPLSRVGLYSVDYHGGNLTPVKTLQKHIFPSVNESFQQSPKKQQNIKYLNAPGWSQFFENAFPPYTISQIGKFMSPENILNHRSNISNAIISKASNIVRSETLNEKKTPKRFFGSFLFGAVTTLEAAIKVNIPIPFCQFPNSPCKIIFISCSGVFFRCFYFCSKDISVVPRNFVTSSYLSCASVI